MKFTPLDIQQQQFRTAFWGFDSKEVDSFLDLLASDVEELMRQNHSLKDELKRRDAELQEYREREQTLKETMITATKITGDIKQNARKEAEIVLGAAENHAEQIIQNAHTRLVRIMEDIDELQRQKAQLEGGLQSMLSTYQKLLDAMVHRNQSSPPVDTISLLRRRTRGAPVEGASDRPEEESSRVFSMRENLLMPRGGDR